MSQFLHLKRPWNDIITKVNKLADKCVIYTPDEEALTITGIGESTDISWKYIGRLSGINAGSKELPSDYSELMFVVRSNQDTFCTTIARVAMVNSQSLSVGGHYRDSNANALCIINLSPTSYSLNSFYINGKQVSLPVVDAYYR